MSMAPFPVIPAEAGIQKFQGVTKMLDPGFHPRIQTLRGRLGDGQNSIYSQLLSLGSAGDPTGMLEKIYSGYLLRRST